MTMTEVKKLIAELSDYMRFLRKDVSEGYLQDALDDLEDIQGISCQIQEAIEQRLHK